MSSELDDRHDRVMETARSHRLLERIAEALWDNDELRAAMATLHQRQPYVPLPWGAADSFDKADYSERALKLSRAVPEIAAAPDMLAALEGIIEDDAPHTSLQKQRDRWNDRMDAAVAAIAKATAAAHPREAGSVDARSGEGA